MPRYNVYYNGKWACFSSIIDAFITSFSDKETYEQWRKEEYGIKNYKPAEQCNMMNMKECISLIKLNRTRSESISCLVGSGLSEIESTQLIDSDNLVN